MGGNPYECKPEMMAAIATLEDKFGVSVWRATAIGSRARGTAHADSDIDVFAFAVNRPTDLVVDRGQLYREFETFDEGPGVDVHLWSIQAVYDGLMDDDPTVVHGITSPSRIYSADGYRSRGTLSTHVKNNLNRYALLHHYRSLAENNYRKYIENGNDTTVDRLFFIVDGLLRARVIEETSDLPPYNAADLAQTVESLRSEVNGATLLDVDLGYEAMIEKKRAGRGDQDLSVEWTDSDLDRIEDELDREVTEYDPSYGSGVDPDTVASLLKRVANEIW